MKLFHSSTLSISSFVILLCMSTTPSAEAFAQEGDKSPFGFRLTAGVKFSDNRDEVSGDAMTKNGEIIEKEDQTEFVITPTVSFHRSNAGRYLFDLWYSPSYVDKDNPRDESVENEWNHSVRGLVDFSLGGRTTLTVSDNYWWKGNEDWHYGEDYQFDPNEDSPYGDDYYRNTFNASLQYLLTADDYITVTAGHNMKRYDDEKTANYADEDEMNFMFELMRREGRHLSYGIYSQYTAYDRKNGADALNGGSTPAVDLGVEYINTGLQISYDLLGNKNFILKGRTGYNFMWYEASDLDDDDMLGDSSIELSLFQQERTSGRIGLRYGKEYSDVYPYSSQNNMTFFASINRFVGAKNKLRLGADFEYRQRTYELKSVDPDADEYDFYQHRLDQIGDDGDAERNTFYVRVNASYRWTEDFSMSAFYSYEDVESDVTSEFDENIFGINATYIFF